MKFDQAESELLLVQIRPAAKIKLDMGIQKKMQ
jgi:hypothetical protein